MGITEEHLGCYVEAKCCTECDWSSKPTNRIPREVCPSCGAPLKGLVGRYRISITTSFFSGVTHDFIGFVRGRASETVKPFEIVKIAGTDAYEAHHAEGMPFSKAVATVLWFALGWHPIRPNTVLFP